MLDYNEIKPKRVIVLEDAPYEVLEAHVFRKQQRKPVNATKLRNLLTGAVREYSFAVSDKVNEAELETKMVTYLYNNRGESWFYEAEDKAKRFSIPTEEIKEKLPFLKPNSQIELLKFGDKIIDLKLPIKVELEVVEAPPSIKGNTAQGGMKQVKLETGATVNAPLFVNTGDILRINTETGEYVERI